MSTDHLPEILPIGTAARLLGVSVKTLRRWEGAGKISAIRVDGGHRRFRRTDIDRLLGVDHTKESSA